jgi:hypothetical protein
MMCMTARDDSVRLPGACQQSGGARKVCPCLSQGGAACALRNVTGASVVQSGMCAQSVVCVNNMTWELLFASMYL